MPVGATTQPPIRRGLCRIAVKLKRA